MRSAATGDARHEEINDARAKFGKGKAVRKASATGTGRGRKMSLTVQELCHLPPTMHFHKLAELRAPAS